MNESAFYRLTYLDNHNIISIFKDQFKIGRATSKYKLIFTTFDQINRRANEIFLPTHILFCLLMSIKIKQIHASHISFGF